MNPALSRHLKKLGLERSPFPPTPDAASYYSTPQLESDLIETAQALRMRAGFVLLTGEVGTGKSTFLRRLMNQLESEGMSVSLVFNTFLQGSDLLAAVLRDFGLAPAGNPAGDIEILNRFLVDCWRKRRGCVLIIDDAQNLSTESLELVRLLTNLETDQEKLLQLVLSGQPELHENLQLSQLRQLTSRICKHVCLAPLTLQDTGNYLRFRLSAAGAHDNINVDADAIAMLFKASKGNPRRIHLIMDRCLYGLYGQSATHRNISAALVRKAASETGTLPALNRATTPMAVAASFAVAAGIALSAGLYWGNSAETTAGTLVKNASPPTTAPAPDVETHCADATFEQSHPIPATTAGLFKHADQACVQETPSGWLLHWQEHTTHAATGADPDPYLLQLQTAMQAIGQYDGPLDGRYGRLTQRAITRLQQQYGLPVTGTANAPTLHLVQTLHGAPLTTSTSDIRHHGNG